MATYVNAKVWFALTAMAFLFVITALPLIDFVRVSGDCGLPGKVNCPTVIPDGFRYTRDQDWRIGLFRERYGNDVTNERSEFTDAGNAAFATGFIALVLLFVAMVGYFKPGYFETEPVISPKLSAIIVFASCVMLILSVALYAGESEEGRENIEKLKGDFTVTYGASVGLLVSAILFTICISVIGFIKADEM